MTVSAIRMFDHFERVPIPRWERYEFGSVPLANLRAGLRDLIAQLSQEDENEDLTVQLRCQLFQWLTVPVDFCRIDETALDIMGAPGSILHRWGTDVLQQCRRISNALEDLKRSKNPLREELDTMLLLCAESAREVSVYCHRSARAHFDSLSVMQNPTISGRVRFLHNARDYRHADSFDTLIKVGPFRLTGYSASPPALLNAARYCELCQFVWAGLRDEDGFQIDPLLRSLTTTTTSKPSDQGYAIDSYVQHLPTAQSTAIDVKPLDDGMNYVDELSLLGRIEPDPDRYIAVTIVGLGGDSAIALPSRTTITLLERNASGLSIVRSDASQLEQTTKILVLDRCSDANLGATVAKEGTYSRQWKLRLNEELHNNAQRLIVRLENAGLVLDSLTSCLRNWTAPATTVIHAPQRKLHFRLLIEQLGIEEQKTAFPRPPNRSWWGEAWKEISRSRVRASQDGIEEHDLLEAERLRILKDLLPTLATKASEQEAFSVDIPDGEVFQGSFHLNPITSVEKGGTVHYSITNCLSTFAEIDKWRA